MYTQPVLAVMRGRARVALLGVLVAALACYPGGSPTGVEDFDAAITLYDQEVNFASFATWAMPDSVVHLVPEGIDPDRLPELSREFDDLILDLVETNMNAAGYTREFNADANGADLIMLVGAIAVENTNYWVSQPWWDWYGYWPGWGFPGYPGYGPGYGWYYPPTYVGSTSFDQGTLALTLVDPNRGDGEELPVVWTGIVRGLAGQANTSSRLTTEINQVFAQSPYLGR